LLCAVTWRI